MGCPIVVICEVSRAQRFQNQVSFGDFNDIHCSTDIHCALQDAGDKVRGGIMQTLLDS